MKKESGLVPSQSKKLQIITHNMKRTTTLLTGLVFAGTLAFGESPDVFRLPEGYDPLNANYIFTPEQLRSAAKGAAPAAVAQKNNTRGLKRAYNAPEASEPTAYFVAAQKYYKGYSFNYQGGDIVTYDIGIKRDGTKVTISNLFNLEAQSTEWMKGVDFDVEGVYDEAAHTITIAAPQDYESATQCGTIGDTYTCLLVAGEVNTAGQISPAESLVFNVIGDFEAIEATQSFGILNYMSSIGSVLGMQTLYRQFYATIPGNEPKLMTYNNSFEFDETFPDTPSQQSVTLLNISGVDVDFAVNVEADDNAFTVTPDAGTISAKSTQELTLTMQASKAGEYEGLASIIYDGVNETPQPIDLLMTGRVKDYPDYSTIVKSGDYKFSTCIDFPFEIKEIEGRQVAHSGLNGRGGSSWLQVEFTVPENNIATLAWKGNITNKTYYANAGGIFIDTLDGVWDKSTSTGEFNRSVELAPGKHFARFQYDAVSYSGDSENGLYIYDLELTSAPAKDREAEVLTPTVDFGNFLMADGEPVYSDGKITLRNRGLQALKVNSATCSDPAFEITVPSAEMGLFEQGDLLVSFKGTEAREYSATVTISTTAGDFTANLKALVRAKADFSPVVTEGSDLVTSFETSDQYPFEVKDGAAYNANSGVADTEATTSWFTINFTIPAGKVGILSWDGHSYGDSPDAEQYWIGDYSHFEIQHPMTSGSTQKYGDSDADSYAVLGSDEYWATYLTCVPGDHYMKFSFLKNGDGSISEKDRLEISNFRIHLVDFPEHGVEAETSEVTFPDTYVGPQRQAVMTVKLKNTGSSELQVLDVTADEPFYGIVPEGVHAVAQFNNSVEVTLWFYPSDEGEFDGELVFKTNAGDVPIKCHAKTLSREGILLLGDIEDSAYGWSYFDADHDGNCWDLGSNLWGQRPEYAHDGDNCLASNSFTNDAGAVEPDNWLFSPEFTVPADGAILNWWTAGFNDERYAEHYSVYVVEPAEIEDYRNLDNLTSVYSNTVSVGGVDGWEEHTFDLKDYAGKTVKVCFRHHDCNGQYILRLDDVNVYTNQRWGAVSEINADHGLKVSTEIYDVNGTRLGSLCQGVNIIRTTYADGTVRTSKIFVNK